MRTYSTEAQFILSKHSFTCKFSLRSYTVITSVKSFFFPKLQLYCRILIKVKQPNKNTASSSTTALDFSFQPWGLISYESSTTTLYDCEIWDRWLETERLSSQRRLSTDHLSSLSTHSLELQMNTHYNGCTWKKRSLVSGNWKSLLSPQTTVIGSVKVTRCISDNLQWGNRRGSVMVGGCASDSEYLL